MPVLSYDPLPNDGKDSDSDDWAEPLDVPVGDVDMRWEDMESSLSCITSAYLTANIS